MSDSYTPEQARAEFIAQEFSETLAKVISEKAALRVTVLQQRDHIAKLEARIAELAEPPDSDKAP